MKYLWRSLTSEMGVNRVTAAVGRPLPVYPDQQTFLLFVGTSQTCQQPTFELKEAAN
jgi:hypothetical protein